MQSYRLTKTIRFKLEAFGDALSAEVNVLKNISSTTEKISEFHHDSKELEKQLKTYLYEIHDKDGAQKKFLKSSLEIKTRFLKQYTKYDYFDWNEKDEKVHKIHQVPYLHKILDDWLGRWCGLVKQLDTLLKCPQENQPRRAEFALLIAEFRKKENLPFICNFINFSQDKKSDKCHQSLLLLSKQVAKILAQCEQIYLPSQTAGVAVARASFNYYTINKQAKNYPKEIQNINNELHKEIENNAEKIGTSINYKNKDIIQKFVVKRIFKRADSPITLDSLYRQLKIYKAEEKSRFLEAANKDVDSQSIQTNHPLFHCEEEIFRAFLEKTKRIKQLSAGLNKQSDDYRQKSNQLKILRQQRGGDFFRRGTKQYKKFCELYKHIAMRRGKILAKIRGLEREKIVSQLLNYWALIVEKHHKHYLMLIPKENRRKAYSALESKHEMGSSLIRVHYFKSLTMRALKKLCFGIEGNTFAPEIRTEFSEHKYNTIQGAFSLNDFEPEQAIVRFYQDVLNTRYVQRTLDIQDFEGLQNLIENTAIATQDEFQTELENICYVKRILAGEELEQYLLNECNASLFAITSYDLRKNSNDNHKSHTKLWHQFWSDKNRFNNYPIRLNPELRIHWREAKESRIKKYGEDSSLYDPDKNNRFLQPQFTLATTITENAIGKYYDLAFIHPDTLAEKIGEFNSDFNRTYTENLHEMYFYGIDRGQAELATLAIVHRFSEQTNEFNQAIPEFAKFTIWRLREDDFGYQEKYLSKGEEKQREVIKNPSYFIDNDNLFEKIETSSIDLTTAKLIKGKIVENGDILSYLKLKELNAKRRLYEYFSQANIDTTKPSTIYFKKDEKVFCVHTLDNNPKATIYYYRTALEQIRSQSEIKTMLNNYLEALQTKNRERDILTIEKINHLRDAIAANIVGIIAHLYGQFPGAIGLENLDKATIKSPFLKSNEDISRHLEWRLYNKFQNKGLVPPRIKEPILLRETKSINQFGVIFFIEKDFTSSACPVCGKIVNISYKNNQKCDKRYQNEHEHELSQEAKECIKRKNKELNERYEDNKNKKRLFQCPHCGFDTEKNPKGMADLSSRTW